MAGMKMLVKALKIVVSMVLGSVIYNWIAVQMGWSWGAPAKPSEDNLKNLMASSLVAAVVYMLLDYVMGKM